MKRLTIIAISSAYWVLWIAAIPWFFLALNRKVTRIPLVRKFFIPQPSRALLQAMMKRSSPDDGMIEEPRGLSKMGETS